MEHDLRDVKLPTILMKINVFFVCLDIIYNASGVCPVIVTFTRTLHYVYFVMCTFSFRFAFFFIHIYELNYYTY